MWTEAVLFLCKAPPTLPEISNLLLHDSDGDTFPDSNQSFLILNTGWQHPGSRHRSVSLCTCDDCAEVCLLSKECKWSSKRAARRPLSIPVIAQLTQAGSWSLTSHLLQLNRRPAASVS